MAKITLPYIQHLSDAIKRMFMKLDIRTSFHPHCTLQQMLVKPKDVVSRTLSAIRCIASPCKNCDCAYVGQTKRLFGVKHQKAVFTGDSERSALRLDIICLWSPGINEKHLTVHNPRHSYTLTEIASRTLLASYSYCLSFPLKHQAQPMANITKIFSGNLTPSFIRGRSASLVVLLCSSF